jgi:protein-S-isoprenylcysteine O-methyltransferase Ste14
MSTDNQPQRPVFTLTRIVSRVLLVMGILAAFLFISAGRWDWPQAWALVLTIGAFLLLYAIWSVRNDPEQLKERSRIAQNVKSWDKVIITVYTALLPMVFILAGLDAGRFGWSAVPWDAQALAWGGIGIAAALVFWTAATNTYLSRQARIQDERGQVVVTSGPYRYVRHPMYLGVIVLFFSLPPALGSCYALVPSIAIDILFVVRTAKEDDMLKEELLGYSEYAQRVRYRLMPGLW